MALKEQAEVRECVEVSRVHVQRVLVQRLRRRVLAVFAREPGGQSAGGRHRRVELELAVEEADRFRLVGRRFEEELSNT